MGWNHQLDDSLFDFVLALNLFRSFLATGIYKMFEMKKRHWKSKKWMHQKHIN